MNKDRSSAMAVLDPRAKEAPRVGPAHCPLSWLLPPLASAVLLWACFFPLSWGWLSWVALVPLLTLVRNQARPRWIYLGAYLGGVAWFVMSLQWMRVADERMVAAWIALAMYLAVYVVAAVALLRYLDRRWQWPLVLSVPVVWVGLEFVRSFMLTGFAWYFLGHTQHRFLPVIQIADLGGAYLVSFLVAMVNGWLADLAFRFPQVAAFFRMKSPAGADFRGVARWGLIVAGLILATLLYGGMRLHQDTFKAGPVVALFQGNLDIRVRAGTKGPEFVREHHMLLGARANQTNVKPDLMIWPETSFGYPLLFLPEDLNQIAPQDRALTRLVNDKLTETIKHLQCPQLIGFNVYHLDDPFQARHYNVALLLNAQNQVEGRYDKLHPLPFGEYAPFANTLPFLRALSMCPSPGDDCLAGEKFTRFTLGPYRFGALICFEDTLPGLTRRYARAHEDGPPVDFLVNMSNDGWFDGSCEHEEHLAISRFRAIEARRALVRSVNMGISGVIDANGRVLKPTLRNKLLDLHVWSVEPKNAKGLERALNPGDGFDELPVAEWPDFKKKFGTIMAMVPIDERTSWYAHVGDWLPAGCWLAVGGAMGVGLVGGWRRRLGERASAKPSSG